MTQAEIKKLKDEHGTVIEFPFDDGKTAFFKKPNRKELKLIMSKGQQGATVLSESYVRNCWIAGDVKVKDICSETNTDYVAQIAATIDDLLMTKRAEIKKH